LRNQTKFYAVRIFAEQLRHGRSTEKNGQDENSQVVIHRFLAMQAQDQRLTATAVQMTGAKDWDDFSIARAN